MGSKLLLVSWEYKVNVSKWLLNTTSAAYLLSGRAYSAHTPLPREPVHWWEDESDEPQSRNGQGGSR